MKKYKEQSEEPVRNSSWRVKSTARKTKLFCQLNAFTYHLR